jgi:hypothetical protein
MNVLIMKYGFDQATRARSGKWYPLAPVKLGSVWAGNTCGGK